MKLEITDKHHYAPVPQVLSWLTKRISTDASVLEVGPGDRPWDRANAYVEFDPAQPLGLLQSLQSQSPESHVQAVVGDVRKTRVSSRQVYNVDLSVERLPFEDKSFDFIYCRHMIEDMYNPFLALKEMERVGKAGYIETPSPIAELCRGVDGQLRMGVERMTPHYRGYYHHRYIAWRHQGELRLVSKYPIIEHQTFNEEAMMQYLREGPRYWNTYHLWEGKINWKHRQHPIDFHVMRDYFPMMTDAQNQSRIATNEFWANIPYRDEIVSLPRSFAAA